MRFFIIRFFRFILLATTVAQICVCNAALSPANLESVKPHKTTTFQKHALSMSYQLDSSVLADNRIQLLQSVFNRTAESDSKIASYHNLGTLSIIKWPILNGENSFFKHGLSESATGIKLDMPDLKGLLDKAALELTAKKHFSGKKLESTKTVTYLADFVKDAILFLGVIYLLLFPVVGSIFGGVKYVQNKRNGL